VVIGLRAVVVIGLHAAVVIGLRAIVFFVGFGNLAMQGRCCRNFEWILTVFALFVGGAPMGGTR
jgi:hypothetical protein